MENVDGFRLCPAGRVVGLAIIKVKEKKRLKDNAKKAWIMLLFIEKEITRKDF